MLFTKAIVLIFILGLALTSAQNLGSDWEGTWTNDNPQLGGFGGSLKICQDQNRVVGIYSTVGYLVGDVDPTTKQVSGNWYQAGLSGTTVGSATTRNTPSPAIIGRSLPNLGTFRFSFQLNSQGDLIGFTGTKNFEGVPAEVYTEVWAATKLDTSRPLYYECGYNPSTTKPPKSAQGSYFLINAPNTEKPAPLDLKISADSGFQVATISWEQDFPDFNDPGNFSSAIGYEEGRCYQSNTVCSTNYYSNNLLENGEFDQGISLYIGLGEDLVCLFWITSSVDDIAPNADIEFEATRYKRTRSTASAPARNMDAVYPVVFSGQWQDPQYEGGSLFICVSTDEDSGFELFIEGSFSNVGYMRGFFNTARTILTGTWVRAGIDAIWDEDAHEWLGNTGTFHLQLGADSHSFFGNITYNPLPDQETAPSRDYSARRFPGIGPIAPTKLECLQGHTHPIESRSQFDINGAWDLFSQHTALSACAGAQTGPNTGSFYEASAQIIVSGDRVDLYEQGACYYSNNVCVGSWWTRDNFGSVIHHVSSESTETPYLQSSYWTGKSAALLHDLESQVWDPTQHFLTEDPGFLDAPQVACDDNKILYVEIVPESSSSLVQLSVLLLVSLLCMCFL